MRGMNKNEIAKLSPLEDSKKILSEFLTLEKVFSIGKFVLIILGILIFFKIINKAVSKFAEKKCSLQTAHIIKKTIHYTMLIVILTTVFNWFGVNLTALLGAAGIAGVAIGFAAQTSVSNIISGLFLMTERAFKISDIIAIKDVIGVVQSIDLLSVTLKTFDSQSVRIPNETIIKSNLINYSHYPFRRVKTEMLIPYGADLKKIEEALLDTARKNEFAISDPEPSIIWGGFEESGIKITLCAWTEIENFMPLKNSIFKEVNDRLKKENITIPFPQLDVYLKKDNEKEITESVNDNISALED